MKRPIRFRERSVRAILLFVPLVAAACARQPAPAAPTPSAPPAGPSARPSMPAQVAAFRLVAKDLNPGSRDTAYRYSNGDSLVHVTAFVYAPSAQFLEMADPQAAVSRDGALFGTVMEIQRQRGIYQEIKKVYSSPDTTLRANGVKIPKHFSGAAVRVRGTDADEIQYLYYVGGWMLKVRATVRDVGQTSSPVFGFANDLARSLMPRR